MYVDVQELFFFLSLKFYSLSSIILGVRLLLCFKLLLLSSSVGAQSRPFMDGDFNPRSADNDPDLILVREHYDALEQNQSLYLRLHDPGRSLEIFSGLLEVQGAEIRELITRGSELEESDLRWGIQGGAYAGPARGLEGNLEGPPGEGQDLIRLERANRLRFWFGCRGELDDLRIIIHFEEEPSEASLNLLLFYEGRPDPEGWPETLQGGIQVGSLERHIAPDDGDYSEVFQVEGIKLLVEDLDIPERGLFMGELGPEGGGLGPQSFHVENFFEERDWDQDNGFDLNGSISPIPATNPLEHLRWSASDLLGDAGGVIPAAALLLENLPSGLTVGAQAEPEISVEVPSGLPGGLYQGRVDVWEDNDLDGLRAPREPGDALWIRLRIRASSQPGEAGLIDLGFPSDLSIPDFEAPPDIGPWDVERLDQEDLGDLGEPNDLGGDLEALSELEILDFSDRETLDSADLKEQGTADLESDGSEEMGAVEESGLDLPRLDLALDPASPGLSRGGALSCGAAEISSPGPLLLCLLPLFLILRRR